MKNRKLREYVKRQNLERRITQLEVEVQGLRDMLEAQGLLLDQASQAMDRFQMIKGFTEVINNPPPTEPWSIKGKNR